MILDKNTHLKFGVDIGGTFTDLLVEGIDDKLRLYKHPTTHDDPLRGLLNSVKLVANDLSVSTEELLGQTKIIIHGTTKATNAIVENKVARTAFVTTKGHRDILVIREGGGRKAPMDYSQEYPRPYIPRSLTFELAERIYADGRVVESLDHEAAIEVINKLKEQRIEAVAVCLLWSVVNPIHEQQFGGLLDEHLPGVPYTLSHKLNPSIREYRRACSTAIDASLKPLMSAYINSLESRLREQGFGGRLLILTSSGGVLDASDIWNTPIHTVGSGPAAAPVAGRHYAKNDVGSDLAIVTDAGGTTFDVGLVQHGEIPWTRETTVGDQKQGFMTGFASIDVRSIGAGGGSIAWVDDGGLLHVGPESAGSDPGPACWSLGGLRSTVTDACVVLGYLDPEYYLGGSMKIDIAAAEKAINTDVGKPLNLNIEAAAAAIYELACQNMVVAIEEISLERGIDPIDTVLIGGGGGGGLYSPTIAHKLGVKQILIPSTSSALSAAGALLSDLRQDFLITHLTISTVFDYDSVNQILQDLKTQCENFVKAVGGNQVTTNFSVEARYPDQVWEIEVPLRSDNFQDEENVKNLISDFHKVHHDLFAVDDKTSPIEITIWRARVSCKFDDHEPSSTVEYGETVGHVSKTRKAFFLGSGWLQAKVYSSTGLGVGESIDGPAFIESPVTTIVVPPGVRAVQNASSSIIINSGQVSKPEAISEQNLTVNSEIGGHELALLNSRLESIVLTMRNTLLRTSRSAIMSIARDFACGILTENSDILTVCESIPCMTLCGPEIQANYMKECNPVLQQGDAFVHNSPYHGNTHPADWTILMPVVDDNGRHRATVYAKAHMADCGNSIPTTFFAAAHDVYEEGALIFPCVKVMRNYELDDDFIRQCRLRIRVPNMWYGDFLAVLGSVRIGERRLSAFFNSVPDGTFETFAKEWLDYSERRMVTAINELPPGKTRVTLTHDPIPGFEDGIPVNVDLNVDSKEAKVIVDLQDNIDCQPFGLNLSESTASSGAMAGVFSSLRQQPPLNTGSYRRIDIRLRENCVVGIPRHPFSCSVATTNLAEQVSRGVALAIAQLGEGFGLAEAGKHMPPALAVISGYDPREGRGRFQNFLCLLLCNGPGAPSADGWLTTIGLGVAGLQYHDSIEVDEMKYPILVTAQYLLPDTEGKGRHIGSPSAYVEYKPVDTKIEVLFTSDGTINAPIGVRGGGNGNRAQQFKRNRHGKLEPLQICEHVIIEPDESIVSICTGAGGYGPPLERDPEKVVYDFSELLVSRKRAREVYGVIMNRQNQVDIKKTTELRNEMLE